MTTADKYFIDEVNELLNNGYSDKEYSVRPKWEDGTPAHTIKTNCVVRKYDLSKEFPILTLRKQSFKNAIQEILWIWQKKSNIVNNLECSNIWKAWEKEDGTIGKAYGYQLNQKYNFPEGYMDQVDHLIYLLKNDPMNRRMIVTLWNNEDLKEMSLHPCAYETIWDVTDNKLNCTLIQRSGDLLAAAGSGGWNTVQYAVLVYMLAQATGYKPGYLNHIVNNLHIYDRHIPLVKEILDNNKSYEAPKLWINPEVKDFYNFAISDFKLLDYNSTKLNKRIEVAI